MEEIKEEDLKMIHYPASNSEIKRECLESHYIRDWDYNKKYRRIKPLEEGTPKYYHEVSKEESHKSSKNHRYLEFGKNKYHPHGGNTCAIYSTIGDNIMSCYAWSISSQTERLVGLRKQANSALNSYKGYKELIKNNTLKWSDPIVRNVLATRKKAWIDISNEIRKGKRILNQYSFQYNKFMEWYRLTNEYIFRLEKELYISEKQRESLKKSFIKEVKDETIS